MFLSSAPGMKMKVLFRADADKDHGLGHLHRCLGLACALRVSNVECVFLVYGGEEARSRAEFLGFETHMANSVALGGDGDLDQTLKIAAETHSIAAVIDSYSTGPQYLANLRSAGLFVAAIDDFALHSFSCHLVVNGAAGAERLPYVSATGDTQFLLGTQYVLLRPEFWNAPERNYVREVKRIMLSAGGTHRVDLLCRILAMLDDLGGDFSITVITGPFSKNPHLINQAAANCKRNVTVESSPKSLYEIMVRSDMALTAAGQTAYELAALGTPIVAFSIADNQIVGLQGFAQQGLCAITEAPQEADFCVRLKEATTELLKNGSSRQRLGLLGRSLIDGRGAFRVADIVQRVPTYSH